jgi:small basic protein (TIGR04137 family)
LTWPFKKVFCAAHSGKIIFQEISMTMHSSLKNAAKIEIRRNVLKRFERVDKLKAEGRWKEGDRGFGLVKTKPE